MFNGDRVLAAILFEQTMDRSIEGKPTATYLWEDKGVVPLLKIDKGLADVADGVQVMKPMPGLDDLLARAAKNGIFGTKERSVIGAANRRRYRAPWSPSSSRWPAGARRTVWIPIIEPEVTISISDKGRGRGPAPRRDHQEHSTRCPPSQKVMLKLTLPTQANHYQSLVEHPKVLRVVALSGGYSRDEANKLLAENTGVIASFSRALTEGLSAQQSDDEFNATLDKSIQSIYDASVTG